MPSFVSLMTMIAVAPAVEDEVVARREAAREAGVGIVNEHAVAVGDDAVLRQEESNRDRAAVGVAAGPAQDRVVVAEFAAAALGLIDAVRAVRIDERREGLGLHDDLRLIGATDGAREKSEQQE